MSSERIAKWGLPIVAGSILLGAYIIPQQTSPRMGIPFDYRVVDGDTIATKTKPYIYYRLIGYNTPEISKPKCIEEYAKGLEAKYKLEELLKSPAVEYRDTFKLDLYQRKLVEIKIASKPLADIFIEANLGVKYNGRGQTDWCKASGG